MTTDYEDLSHPAREEVQEPQKRVWRRPVIDTISMSDARAGTGSTPDGNGPGTQVS